MEGGLKTAEGGKAMIEAEAGAKALGLVGEEPSQPMLLLRRHANPKGIREQYDL